MHQVAKCVWQLTGFPPNVLNAYLVEDVLIDAATRWARGRILALLRRRPLSLVALTHCHPDHQGTAAAVCTAYRVPLACHADDVAAMEGRAPMTRPHWLLDRGIRLLAGPLHPVAQVLHDGDLVAGFRVIHTPGHTPGHVVYFRESDRLAIAGDLLANMNVFTGRAGLRQPPSVFSFDPAQNRRSIRLLAQLRPAVVCFGHGPPLRDGEKLQEYVARMPLAA